MVDREAMIHNDQELKITRERIARFEDQLAHLRPGRDKSCQLPSFGVRFFGGNRPYAVRGTGISVSPSNGNAYDGLSKGPVERRCWLSRLPDPAARGRP